MDENMKAHLAKLSLALLSAAFLLGCQEQGSEPVGPEGPQFDRPSDNPCPVERDKGHCHGDDVGASDPITLDLADGMETTGLLAVTVNQDTSKKLNVGASDVINIEMNFTEPGSCVGFKATKNGVLPSTDADSPEGDEVAKLKTELIGLVKNGFFIMKINKTNLGSPSDGNLLLVERDGTFDSPNGHTRIMLGGPFDQVGQVTVTLVSESTATLKR